MKTSSPSPLSEATSLHMAGKLDEAETRYRQLLNEDANAVTSNNLAFLLSQRGQFEESIRFYRKAIEISADYATAYTNLGQTLLSVGQYEEAGRMLTKAIQLDQDDFHANKGLANFYMLKGNLEDAEIYLKISYALRATGELLLDLAWCLLSQGKLHESATVLGYAEDAEKNNARYHSLWGLIHFAGNNFGQAVYCFRQSLGLEPENLETRNNLVACLLKTGSTEEASVEMQRILLMSPGHIESLNNLAVLALASSHPDQSIRYLDKVIEQDPENGKGLYYKAICCLQLERKEEGIEMLKHIVESGRSFYTDNAREALELLTELTVTR